MTTIAVDAKEGVMCSDSFWFNGDECGVSKKVWRVRGALLGAAGSIDHIKLWMDAYRANKTLPKHDVHILRLSVTGIDCWTVHDGWHSVDQPQFAIGSGGKAARAAMAAGATCKRAARIACDIDASSGGPIREYKL
jgi:ATP-dependent protease HslVU (ClpYQ) peptidase subunit